MPVHPWILATIVTLTLAATATADEDAADQLVPLVVELLQDQDGDIRALGLEQVRSQAQGRAATERFAALLPTLSPDAQVGLLSALADRGDAAARPAVLGLISDSDAEDVRVAAIAGLGWLGNEADLPLFLEFLSANSEAEQAAARDSLIRLPGESTSRLIAGQLADGPLATRITLIEILATRRALETIGEILTAAVDSEATVRAAAMTALGQLAGPEHLPGMVQGVLKAEPGGERSAAEKAVMFVCGRIADQENRAAPLLAALDELESDDQLALLPTLGRVGGSAALRVIEKAVADARPAVHEVGVIAMCHWPDASIASRLIELTHSDSHAACRTRALRALIRVAPLPDDRSDQERLELLQRAMSMCTRDAERLLALERAKAIRTVETLRFVTSFLDDPAYAQMACLTIVELAHHRGLREPHKAEFDQALDKVIETSEDAVVIDRANRYKKGQTWVRPTTRP